MTFDEAIEHFRNNTDISGTAVFLDDVEDILKELREEYAPTIIMTNEQYKGLLFKGKGRETPHKNFVFLHEVQKLNDRYISITSLMNAFAHPETIKVVDE
ncbi:hypothetical protein [Leuconostoc suionicum]|uniref:hypothetical protein n=1 Tax=Leuconostoc suionicum TaxID=1511761 RepID=UPI00233F341A|nr:hypothetical protein [Leuconostoc suionicum]MDC2804809.1 hypothetical protein [Leuconostoc suionicum]MDC2822321.1 hypothetical protein [Leuconostoc suionicum]